MEGEGKVKGRRGEGRERKGKGQKGRGKKRRKGRFQYRELQHPHL
jgi:hypothetical protein